MFQRLMVLFACLFAGAVMAADTYELDRSHSRIGFTIDHMNINLVYGHFNEYTAVLTVEDGKVRGADVTIQTASIDTGIERRDDHLRNDDFFSADKHPTITYKATKMEQVDGHQVLIGTFTMSGISKELRLPLTIKGPITDPQGRVRIGLSGGVTIDRTEFGIDYHRMVPGVGAMVGKEVHIQIDAEAIMKKE